jgi:hypothetical protein
MKKISLLIFVSLFFFLLFSLAYAQTTTKEDTTKAPVSAKPKYVGSLVCKPCHNFEKTTGKQYDKWAGSKHATAYKTLSNEQSKKIAAEKKIDDPLKSEKCLKCHLTGYAAKAEEKGLKYDINEGVSCEGCHGAGGKYMPNNVMKDPKLSKDAGLIMPTEKECKVCHNPESPTYKEFKFAEAWKLVAHSAPKVK